MVREDIANLTAQAGAAEFPYVEVRATERARAAATRWPLLVSTNRMLGVPGTEAIDRGPSRVRSSDPQFAAPPPADPQARELEESLPLLRSTRRFSSLPRAA